MFKGISGGLQNLGSTLWGPTLWGPTLSSHRFWVLGAYRLRGPTLLEPTATDFTGTDSFFAKDVIRSLHKSNPMVRATDFGAG